MAQWIARQTSNLKVVGSSPISSESSDERTFSVTKTFPSPHRHWAFSFHFLATKRSKVTVFLFCFFTLTCCKRSKGSIAKTRPIVGLHRPVVRTSRCGRENASSILAVDKTVKYILFTTVKSLFSCIFLHFHSSFSFVYHFSLGLLNRYCFQLIFYIINLTRVLHLFAPIV